MHLDLPTAAFIETSTLVSMLGQKSYRLHMPAHPKHITASHALHRVSSFIQILHIARQCGGIATDIDYPLWLHPDDRVEADAVTAFARRIDDDDVREAIIKSEYNADVLPSNTQLAGAPIELVSVPRREMRLRTVLAPVVPLYDYIFIDCAPSLDLLTVNALCAADTVIIPMQCEFFALEGLSELMATLKTVRKKYNRYLDIEGVLFTMYSGRLNLTMQVVAQVKKYFGDKVYRAVIPRTVRLSEAPSFGMPINFYEPNGKGSEAYMELAREFLANNER